MTRRRTWLPMAALAVMLAVVVGCAQAPLGTTQARPVSSVTNADGYSDISVEQLAGMLENEDIILINVHIPYEGEIPQTDLFIPFDDIAARVSELPAKDAPIVLYCRSGSMSTTAAKTLVSLGYANILEVDGGMRAWQSAGYELL